MKLIYLVISNDSIYYWVYSFLLYTLHSQKSDHLAIQPQRSFPIWQTYPREYTTTWLAGKFTMFDRRFIFNWLFFNCHLSFPGVLLSCICGKAQPSTTRSQRLGWKKTVQVNARAMCEGLEMAYQADHVKDPSHLEVWKMKIWCWCFEPQSVFRGGAFSGCVWRFTGSKLCKSEKRCLSLWRFLPTNQR